MTIEKFENKRPTLRWVVAVVLIILVAVLFIVYLDDVGSVLNALWKAVEPLVIGAVFAYLINLIMTRYEKHWFPNSTKPLVNRTRRGVCLALAILTVTAIIVFLVVLIVSEFSSAASAIVSGLTDLVNMVVEFLMDIPAVAEALEGEDTLTEIANTIISALGGASEAISSIVDVGIDVVQIVISVFLGMIYTLYLLLDKERVIKGAKRLVSLIPNEKARDYVFHVGTVANGCFSRFIFGQCVEACILGTLCALGNLILGFPYAVPIGVIVGMTSIIPYLGAWIGGAVGVIMILSVDPIQAIQFLIFLLILQQVEGHLIYPNVVGRAAQLPSVWVFSAVIVGGSLFGVPGVLLSVPVVSTVRTLWMEYLEKRDAKEAEKLAIVEAEAGADEAGGADAGGAACAGAANAAAAAGAGTGALEAGAEGAAEGGAATAATAVAVAEAEGPEAPADDALSAAAKAASAAQVAAKAATEAAAAAAAAAQAAAAAAAEAANEAAAEAVAASAALDAQGAAKAQAEGAPTSADEALADEAQNDDDASASVEVGGHAPVADSTPEPVPDVPESGEKR